MSLRVNGARDASLSVRDDLLEDLLDSLKQIKKNDSITLPNGNTYTFKTTPKLNIIWRTDPLQSSDLPANILFDQDSEGDDNLSRVKHKVNLSVKHVARDGDKTSETLKSGVMDIMKCFHSIEAALVRKYNLPHGLRFLNSTIGVEAEGSTNGAMEIVYEVTYMTERYTL